MPSTSEKMRRTAGMALSVKRGETPASRARGPVRQMMSMSENDLEDYASSIRKSKKKASHNSPPMPASHARMTPVEHAKAMAAKSKAKKKG